MRSVFVAGGDVYVAGWVLDHKKCIATYWKNSVSVHLSDTTDNIIYWQNGKPFSLDNSSYNSRANSIFVYADGDVHTCGYINSKAAYWKNTTAAFIDPASDYNGSFCSGIFLSQHQ